MERAHRQLGAGLADRLGGDDADRLADIDPGAARQVTAIARAADAALGLAGQHRADLDRFDTRAVDRVDHRLVEQRSGGHDHVLGQRIDHVDCRAPPEQPVGQRLQHLAAVDDRAHRKTVGGAAILLQDRAVLRHVHQPARQIARIGRLERRIGQPLARAVRGVEVLQHRQSLLEVGDNRRLDDLARRLGHQAAHPGELLHLGGRAAGAGMGHHVNRVDRLAGLGVGDALHHLLGHVVGAARPGIEHLVVLLALGDQAFEVLLLELLDVGLGGRDHRLLGVRDHQVILAEGDAGLAAWANPIAITRSAKITVSFWPQWR